MALAVVTTPEPMEKARLAAVAFGKWLTGDIPPLPASPLRRFPQTPGRPPKPQLLPPQQMPRRRPGG